MLCYGIDLISLLAIIPNIHCLHVSLIRTYDMFESVAWSSIVLPHIVEFYLWAELGHDWTADELMILLHIMPTLQQLSLNIVTSDACLLDGEQIRSLLSTMNIVHLDEFNYAVEYFGESLERSIIVNLRQKWLPQPIAFYFDAECRNICLYTIPFKFHLFWTRMFSLEAKMVSVEKNLTICYGEDAYIARCHSLIPTEYSDLYAVMQKACRVESLTLRLPNETERNAFRKYLSNIYNDD